MVIPLEDEISKTAVKHFPRFQHRFGPLAERLKSLDLPGEDRVRALNQELADVLAYLNSLPTTPRTSPSRDSAFFRVGA